MSFAIPPQPGPTATVDGDTEAAERMAKQLIRAANAVEGEQDFATGQAIRGVGERMWSGAGAAAYLAAIAPFAAGTSTAYTGLIRGAKVLQTYADALIDLQKRRRSLDEERSELTRDITNFADEVGQWQGTPIPGPDVDALQARSAELNRRLVAFTSNNEALRTDTASAERAVLHGLAGYRGVASTAESLTRLGHDPARLIRSALKKIGPGAHPPDIAHLSPQARARWWAGLTPAEREAALQEFPEYIGSGDGLPARVRDAANRHNLDRDIAESQAVLTVGGPDGRRGQAARQLLGKASAVAKALEAGAKDSAGAPVQLYAYDPRAFGGDGAAVISIGDMDRARNVAWNVPGMSTDMASAADNTSNAARLFREAGGLRGNVASVVWIGYDAPSGSDAGNVVSQGAARRGGDRLVADVEGYLAARDQLGLGQGVGASDRLNLTVIGHSYGATTTSWAGHAGRLAGDVDSIALIGSPGSGAVTDAAEFGVGHVYVGSSSNDVVAHLGSPFGKVGTMLMRHLGAAGYLPVVPGALGMDPATTAFGADRFRAEDGAVTSGIGSHASYYQDGTESLRNLSRIVSGHGDRISHEYRRSTADVIDGWDALLSDDRSVMSRIGDGA